MKKLSGIVVLLGLLLSIQNSFAVSVSDYLYKGMSKKELRQFTMPMGLSQPLFETEEFLIYGGFARGGRVDVAFCPFSKRPGTNGYKYFSKYKTEVFTHPVATVKDKYGYWETKYQTIIAPGIPWYVVENVTKPIKCGKFLKVKKGNGTLKAIAWSKEEAYALANPEYAKKYSDITFPTRDEQVEIARGSFKKEEEKRITEKPKKQEPKKQEEIMFTIKDKREQCEAIGFKPETEKFADCVLRLVELDVKQQTQNQIAVAQNNGNDALVKQLKRQSDLQSSQALIDLGQQLMNPKRYNSNIYMPQTQRCTMQGFGSFATMRCR